MESTAEYQYFDTNEYDNDSSYKTTVRCLWMMLFAGIIAGLLYVLSGSVYLAALIFVPVIILLTLIHIHFGLLVLYFLLPVESAIIISPYFTISKAMALIVLVSYLFHLSHARFIFPRALNAILILMIWALMSIVWAASASYAIVMTMPLLLNIGLMIIFISIVQDKKNFNMILGSLFFGACMAAMLIAIGKASYGGTSSSTEAMERAALSEGMNSNILADALLMGCISAFFLFMQKGLLRKIIILMLIPLVLYGILKTQSRTVWGGVVIVPTLALIFAAKGRKRITYTILAIFFASVVIVSGLSILKSDILPEKAKTRLRGTGQALASEGRLEMWKQGAHLFAQRPFNGWGWSNFPVKIGLEKKLASSHSNIVGIASELGIVGLFLAGLIYFYLFKEILQAKSVPLRWLGLAMIFYTLLTGATGTTYIQKDYWYALTFTLTICIILKNQPDENMSNIDIISTENDTCMLEST